MKKSFPVILFLFSLWFHTRVLATFLSDSSNGFFLRTHGIAIRDLLILLGKSYHTPVIVSNRVNGIFMGEIKNISSVRILRNLSDEFGLVWYYNGSTLYVNSAQEITSRVFVPNYTSAQRLYDNIKSGINLSSPFNVIELRKFAKSIWVSGTPVFIRDVTSLEQTLDTQQYKQVNNKVEVKVFPLIYNSVKDTKFSYAGKDIIVPGVAKEVNDLLGSGGQQKEGVSLPKITIDERQNAITIMGLGSKMQMYANLIAQLDKPQKAINVSVKIIDVNVGNLGSLGVEWSYSKQITAGRFSFNNTVVSPSGSLSAVLDNTKGFVVKINALENQSKAHIISSPSVFTLDNMPAILDRNTTFYARLQGERNSRLQQISTGETLRVLPHLIYGENTKKEIMLTLFIEDGSPANNMEQIDNLPQTQNAQISTIARLKEGQSLLIGGFMRNKETMSNTKIPFLGDIPVIGNLFGSKIVNKQHMVRLFLIQAAPVDA